MVGVDLGLDPDRICRVDGRGVLVRPPQQGGQVARSGPPPTPARPDTPDTGSPLPVAVEPAQPSPGSTPAVRNALAADQRALVVVSATSITGRADLARLYRLLDKVGPDIAKLQLAKRYDVVEALVGPQATRVAIVETLKTVATSGYQAVDMILMVHGEPDTLVLAGPGGQGTDEVLAVDLAGDLVGLPELSGKLRLCYSTVCFGQSHAQALLAAGFTAVIGAKAINANSATELPLLLSGWGRGDPIGAVLRRADNPEVRVATDFVAQHFGFTSVDSEKVLLGEPATTIDTVAALGFERVPVAPAGG